MLTDTLQKLSIDAKVAAVLFVWFAAALALSISGAFYLAPAPVIGGTVWSLVALVLLAYWRIKPFRMWIDGQDIRLLMAPHAFRFVGVAFLVLVSERLLPDTFILAGWGDILAAVSGIVLAVWWPSDLRKRRRALLAWNTFGLLDILLVVFTGLSLGLEHIASVALLTAFPLSLLPTFLVPLIISTHVLIYVRLRAERSVS